MQFRHPLDLEERFAAPHNQENFGSGGPLPLPDGDAHISTAVEAHAPLSVAQQASVAHLGERGLISPKLAGGGSSREGRAAPQARIVTNRDRRPIPGAKHPNGDPAIGRPVISPILILGGASVTDRRDG